MNGFKMRNFHHLMNVPILIPVRLHHLQINQREDGSVLVPGRAILPARHRGTLRHQINRPGMGSFSNSLSHVDQLEIHSHSV